MRKIPRIIITPGEPAGIGPDITVKVAQKNWAAELVVIADPNLLISRAAKLKLPLNLIPFDQEHKTIHHSGTLKIIPVPLAVPSKPGILNVLNAPYVLECLKLASDVCLTQKADALVTGPIQKSIINQANIPFTGHTEFLETECQIPQTIMLFVTPHIKVALATTHLPLKKVPSAIQSESLLNMIRLLDKELRMKFSLAQPRILVCGLNPHAGEEGHLGTEEIEIIKPCIEMLRNEKINVRGPFAADTIFTAKQLKEADVILAMYHDQALPVVKYMSFGKSVNVTLGLPIIRTSVDHGTALDIAGTSKANEESLASALDLALQLCHHRFQSENHD